MRVLHGSLIIFLLWFSFGYFSLSKNPGVDKGPQPLMFNPALTTCASERMKTQRFSYFAGFAARERMREAKPVKLKKVAFSHFFDTLKPAMKMAGSANVLRS